MIINVQLVQNNQNHQHCQHGHQISSVCSTRPTCFHIEHGIIRQNDQKGNSLDSQYRQHCQANHW